MMSRKDYIVLANIWVHILSEMDEDATSYEIHDRFVEYLNGEYVNFDIDKWSNFIAYNANTI